MSRKGSQPGAEPQAITALANTKLGDIVHRYDGTGDLRVWIRQVEIAKEVLGLDEVARLLPLFLGGKAFSVYDQLSPEDQKVEEKIFRALRSAFSLDPIDAFERLRALSSGESVHVCLTDIRDLVCLMGVPKSQRSHNLKLE